MIFRTEPLLIILTAPSGTGKTTLAKIATANDPWLISPVSVTTRPKRHDEIDGQDYHFVDANTFQIMIDNEQFIEYANVLNYRYGITKKELKQASDSKDIILTIDWQGMQRIKELAAAVVTIYVLPPSLQDLRQRLINRTGSIDDIEYRMSQVADSILHHVDYDYLLVNNKLEQTLDELNSIITAERHKRQRLNCNVLLQNLLCA